MSDIIQIKVPHFGSDEVIPQLKFLTEVNRRLSYARADNTFEFDFRFSRFCSSFLLGVLHTIIQRHVNDGGSAYPVFPKDGLGKYLELIKFGKDFCINNPDEISMLDAYKDKSYLPITQFVRFKRWDQQLSSEIILTHLLNLICRKVNADAQMKNDIDMILSELTDNINDHSESVKGLVTAQHYPNHQYIEIVISDFGQGVLKSYDRNKNFSPVTYSDALRFAWITFYRHLRRLQLLISLTSNEPTEKPSLRLPVSELRLIGINSNFLFNLHRPMQIGRP